MEKIVLKDKGKYFLMMVILLVVSCTVTKNYKHPSAYVDSKLYRDVDTTDTTGIGNIPWKKIFTDSLLQLLIQEGIDHNLDLKIAMARIKQAQANLRQSNAAFYPTLSVNANIPLENSVKTNNIVTSTGLYQLYASAGWEADIWGKLRSMKRAQLAAFMQSEAYKRAVQTQLVSDIASNYYTLLAYDAQLEVTLKTVENRKLDVEIMNKLKQSDVVTGAGVVQSEANRYSVEVTIPDLKQNIRVTENALSILLGRNPGIIIRDSLNHQQVWSDIRTGIPLQLLANRPDVQEAEFQFRYYAALTDAARAYFYPSLTISAEAGLFNTDFSKLFNPASFFGNIIIGLAQPIFNHGLNKQRLNLARAQEEEYLETFKKTLLSAGEEVSNALYNYQSATDKIKLREQQIAFLQKAVDFTKELLKYTANTNYTDVLTSEQSLLAAQLSSVSDKLQQLQSVISLYRSLGGGWK